MQNGFLLALLKIFSKRFFFPGHKPPWIKAPPFIRPPKAPPTEILYKPRASNRQFTVYENTVKPRV